MNTSSITCPKCQTLISIDEVLGHQIEESLKQEYDQKSKQELDEVRKKAREWQEAKEKEFASQEKETKLKIEAELRRKLLEESEKVQKSLQDELEDKKKQLQEARDLELSMRKKQVELEEREKNFELEKQRQIDEERQKIKQDTAEQLLKEHQMRDAEKNKQMEDMRKKIEELQQKANLTSQQLQGEVLELELEEFLKKEFPQDQIKPVAKGVVGADVLQVVCDQFGRVCGTIIWESKRTKNWTESWIPKLKDDMRAASADVAILVSQVMPAGIKFFGPKDGIFVTCFECLLGVSSQIRLAIIKESQIKSSVVGKNEKMEVLWDYLSSNQFSQKVEAIVEAFSVMKEDLEKEKRVFSQMWSKREKQIERVINNTASMHGELQGLMGTSLPQIKSLELESFEMLETSEVVVSTEDDKTYVQTTLTQTVIEES